jgi:ferritin-like metal-binding protein YciE
MPPQIEAARGLLLEQLGSLLTTESTLARLVLPQLVKETQDEHLKELFGRHLEETRAHEENVRQAFATIDEQPAGRAAQGLDGLRAEHATTVEKLAPGLRAGYDCAAAMGTEHYEINSYEAAIRLAEALREATVARLLRTNLEQEITSLQKLAAQADRLAAEAAQHQR